MRVLFATDRIGGLTSFEAGSALATGWQEQAPGSELAVVAMGESGRGFGQAAADLLAVEPVLLAPDAPAPDAGAGDVVQVVRTDDTLVIATQRALDHRAWVPQRSSVALGRVLADELRRHAPATVVLDLGGVDAQDAGAGVLHGLGARADRPLDEGVSALTGVTDVDLSGPRRLLASVRDLTVVVPAGEVGAHLLGLRGSTSLRGTAQGIDTAETVAADAAVEAFAGAVAPEAAAGPGAGACGTAFALVALGARVVSGPQWCAESVDLPATLRQATLVVTGTEVFDFATRGGGVVQYLADAAGAALRPCLAAAGTVLIGAREMRTMGIETAYAVGGTALGGAATAAGEPVGTAALVALGGRIARTWDR